MERNEQLNGEGFHKVILTIGVSGIITFYIVQIVCLLFGGRPTFDDIHAIGVTCAVVFFFLLIGWATRRVWLVTIIATVCCLAFLTPYLFALRGAWQTWMIQLVGNVGTPLASGWMFQFMSKFAGVPERPKFRKRESTT